MRRLLILVLLGVLILPSCSEAGSLVLTNVRFWTAPDHTRVVVDLSGYPTFAHRVLSRPHRIAVDIKNTKFEIGTRKIRVDDGLIVAIRLNALRSGTAQVVLDLHLLL